MERMTFAQARDLDLTTAAVEQLTMAWRAYADQISHHHADDSGREWGLASALMPKAREIELAIRAKGGERPTGSYLMAADDRIDWETGDWSRGWVWKKREAL